MDDLSKREWRIGEILRASFGMLKAVYKYCVPLCLLVYVPLNVIELFVPPEYSLGILLTDPMGVLDTGMYNQIMGFGMLMQVIRLLFTCLVTGGYTYVAMAKLSGKPISRAGLMDLTLGKWFALAFTAFLFTLIISLTAVLIIPAIYFAVLFTFHLNVAAVTTDRGFKALLGSAKLVRGQFLKRLAYAFSFLFMQAAFTVILSNILTPLTPSYYASPAPLNGLIIVVLNVIIETLASVFILAQAVWFVNILMHHKMLDVRV